ncbi:MAG: 23S rRNA (pseudouridine(1915)-N(3))-methyltransferase RlmH [Flavobacteriales bacterium]|nr:23S rRNA (pseudouridine(1915)-N(3))-methyltransferase RlmH [Flavobacteriales bacterium]
MTIRFLVIGKTDSSEITSIIDNYLNRIKHYIRFEYDIIPDIKNVKNLSEAQQKEKEGELILSKIANGDHFILLDERGKKYSSIGYSELLQKKMNSGIKNLIFVVGGPYGFSESVYQRADGKVSLSDMTFSHQMIRMFFVEQTYRALTILRNEPYHHQ